MVLILHPKIYAKTGANLILHHLLHAGYGNYLYEISGYIKMHLNLHLKTGANSGAFLYPLRHYWS
jgi:hypothetical protein